MLIARLHHFLTTPSSKLSNSRTKFWFGLSLAVAGIYSFIGLREAFSSQYIVHDDVRQHVFWMRRFLDPELFPNDLITDYYQSVAPYGYATLYRLMASLGIDPVVFSKFLPIILILATTAYCFGICIQLFPVPAAGFIATLFLNQTIWFTHDVPSGTARSFFYPLFLAFLYYLLRRSLLPCLVAIALQGLFYPSCIFVSSGILVIRLFRLENWRVRLSPERSDYIFCTLGLAVAAIGLLPYVLKVSDYGPATTASEARKLPTFQASGRKDFFYDNPIKFWLCASRSGMLPFGCTRNPLQFWLAVSLPFLLAYSTRFPLGEQVSRKVVLLPQIVLASLGMFFAAHAVLFKLYLPSRYTQFSLRIVVAIAAGIALLMIIDAVFRVCERRIKIGFVRSEILAVGFVALLAYIILAYPSPFGVFPNAGFATGKIPALYEFFAQQPKDTLIASLSTEANNIPTYSQRSILVSDEYANPYHLGFYRKLEERLKDLIRAQYSQDLTPVKDLIQKYGIDFVLLDRNAFTPEYIENNRWLTGMQPAATEAVTSLKQGVTPALAKLMESCSVFQTEGTVVLPADCIIKANNG